MGYDMRYDQKPEGEAEAVKAAQELFNAACKERDALPKEEQGQHRDFKVLQAEGIDIFSDEAFTGRSDRYRAAQAKVSAAMKDVNRAEKSYFRLNIFGMGKYRDLMEALGMVYLGDPGYSIS